MLRILPFILLVLLVMLALRWFVKTPPAQLARALRRWSRFTVLALMVVAGVWLSMRGLEELGLPLIAYAVSAWRQGWWPWGGPAGGHGGTGQTAERKSEVRTRMLRMELEHASGRMDGEVLDGTFSGRWLSDLSDAELQLLYEECARAGDQSLKLLEAWLQRERPGFAGAGAAGQADSGAAEGASASDETSDDSDARMTLERAREILGVGPEATAEEIRAAHRRLMKTAHPDVGGSAWLAKQLNLARDVLLRAMQER